MKFIIIITSILLPFSFAAAEWTCTATCINAQSVSYLNGPSYTILNSAVEIAPSTARTKRDAFRVLRRRCDPYLLVISHEAVLQLGIGRVLISHTEAKRRNACRRGNRQFPQPQEEPSVVN